MLDNEQLRDAKNGVTYFKDTRRPFVVKGANHVFLWRYLTFFRTYRGNLELVHWIGKFEIALRRLRVAWGELVDLADVHEIHHPDFADILTAQQVAAIGVENDRECAREMAVQFRNQVIEARHTQHAENFHLMTA